MIDKSQEPVSAGQPAISTPLKLALAFSRARDAGDKYAFCFAEQDYVLEHEDHTQDNASFPWGDDVIDDLAAVQHAPLDRAAAARLGDRLRAFLRELGWSDSEARLREAQRKNVTVHLTVRSNAAELYALPWEFLPLGESGLPLGALPRCLIRYEWTGTETKAPSPDPPREGGRILFA